MQGGMFVKHSPHTHRFLCRTGALGQGQGQQQQQQQQGHQPQKGNCCCWGGLQKGGWLTQGQTVKSCLETAAVKQGLAAEQRWGSQLGGCLGGLRGWHQPET